MDGDSYQENWQTMKDKHLKALRQINLFNIQAICLQLMRLIVYFNNLMLFLILIYGGGGVFSLSISGSVRQNPYGVIQGREFDMKMFIAVIFSLYFYADKNYMIHEKSVDLNFRNPFKSKMVNFQIKDLSSNIIPL